MVIKIRCLCCNKNLSDYESTLRRVDTGEFVDICKKCLEDIPIQTIGREDLENTSENEEEYWEEDNGDF